MPTNKQIAKKEVTTYQSPMGAQINVCPACSRKQEEEGGWWKDDQGQEYCHCAHGLHNGYCDVCQD
jgi:hypothetical protein